MQCSKKGRDSFRLTDERSTNGLCGSRLDFCLSMIDGQVIGMDVSMRQ